MNYLAIIVAAIINMALGFIWYGPLFGKQWIKLMGYTKESMEKAKKGMEKTYAMMFAGALVMAYVLSMLIARMNVTDLAGGVTLAFWAWFGFIAPVLLAEVLFGGKKWELYYINVGYQLVAMLAMGTLLASWM